MRPLYLTSLLALCASVASQTVTIPATAVNRDGSGVFDVAGLERAGRLQILIGQRHLLSAVGRELTVLRLRRDGARFDLRGGALSMTVRVSAATNLDPNAPSSLFAQNHRNPAVMVFQGTVVAPTSPGLANRDAATWSPADIVEVLFTTPFTYAGGTLCIQLDVIPVTGSVPRWWPIDGERESPGTVTHRGVTCGTVGQLAPKAASVDARSLRIGNTASFTTLGQTGSTAVLMLSPQTIGPIDLSFLGAAGCNLYVLPDVTVTAIVGAPIGNGRPGTANIALHLPNEGRLLAAQLHAQWLLVHNLTLATTNVIDLQIAPSPSSLDAAVVGVSVASTTLPDAGRIELMLPVLQLGYR